MDMLVGIVGSLLFGMVASLAFQFVFLWILFCKANKKMLARFLQAVAALVIQSADEPEKPIGEDVS